MIDYKPFYLACQNTPLEDHLDAFPEILKDRINARKYGDLPKWEAVLGKLPQLANIQSDFQTDEITLSSTSPLSNEEKVQLENNLRELHPWRKGPFNIFDIHIDTEWRSDWKWQRISPHISDLTNRHVLDVGCGSGYHCWRMRGEGAKLVVGIDPSPKNIFQFEVVKRYTPTEPVFLLPLKSEDMPAKMQAFDTVFSMGVLYHRRSPFDHLEELKDALRPGGELIIETLVVDGDEHTVLLPKGRYAQMRNVWFLPSTAALELWLQRLGFKNIRTVDVNTTSTEEQRTTEWMTFQSLRNFLDPNDIHKTLEGYPAPKRAFIIAEK